MTHLSPPLQSIISILVYYLYGFISFISTPIYLLYLHAFLVHALVLRDLAQLALPAAPPAPLGKDLARVDA